MGVAKTFLRLHHNFDWPHIHDDVHRLVSQCVVCQQMKYETKKPVGLLQPLPVPSSVWEDVSLDFITGLPPFHRFTTILVVVDHFSKGAHFGALPPHNSAYKTAMLFLDMVCKHHGFLHSLISDRDSLFFSSFWNELFRLIGTKLRMSTTYHPQRTDKWRLWIEFWSSTSVHLSMIGHLNGFVFSMWLSGRITLSPIPT